MSQASLAARSNLSTKHINQVIQGIAPLTHDTALILERVTGTPARVWNALEAAYRDSLARNLQRSPTPADEEWLQQVPVAELVSRGYRLKGRSASETLQNVLSFFGVADRTAWERIWLKPSASFRRSQVFRRTPGATAAWLRLGELEGHQRNCQPFDPKVFRKALSAARTLTRNDDFSDELIAKCAEAGVALVFVTEIPGCRASGAARWLTPTKALVQLSDRHKREDSFWFSLFHEGGHLLLHSKRELFVDDGSPDDDVLESEANGFAADFLIPAEKSDRLRSLRTIDEITRFADELGIAPGIVVGRLHNDGKLDWSKGNQLIRKVRIVGS